RSRGGGGGGVGPPPAGGAGEAGHAAVQGRPDAWRGTPVSQAAEQPIVGGAIVSPTLEAAPLNALGATGAPVAPSAPSAPTAQ
ncbi:hypothetical protein NYD60_22380, partial [Burkholderia thailandensis]|nr:hypothetical protein [Burkholderia thailandensis]